MQVLLSICLPLLVWPFTLFDESDCNVTFTPKLNLVFSTITISVKLLELICVTLLVLWFVSNDKICVSYHNGAKISTANYLNLIFFSKNVNVLQSLLTMKGSRKLEIKIDEVVNNLSYFIIFLIMVSCQLCLVLVGPGALVVLRGANK